MFHHIYCPSSYLRPYTVHFHYCGKPSELVVLAKSECHAVQVMYRHFEITEGSLASIIYDRTLPDCYVSSIYFFSDSLYKFYKTYGNIEEIN